MHMQWETRCQILCTMHTWWTPEWQPIKMYIYIYNMQHVVRICILPLHEACLLRIQRFPRLDVDPGKLGSLFDSLGKG